MKHQDTRKTVLMEKYQPYLDTLDQMERELKTKLGIGIEEEQKEEQEQEKEVRSKRFTPNKKNNKR